MSLWRRRSASEGNLVRVGTMEEGAASESTLGYKVQQDRAGDYGSAQGQQAGESLMKRVGSVSVLASMIPRLRTFAWPASPLNAARIDDSAESMWESSGRSSNSGNSPMGSHHGEAEEVGGGGQQIAQGQPQQQQQQGGWGVCKDPKGTWMRSGSEASSSSYYGDHDHANDRHGDHHVEEWDEEEDDDMMDAEDDLRGDRCDEPAEHHGHHQQVGPKGEGLAHFGVAPGGLGQALGAQAAAAAAAEGAEGVGSGGRAPECGAAEGPASGSGRTAGEISAPASPSAGADLFAHPGGLAAAVGSRYTSISDFSDLREIGKGCSATVYSGTCRDTGAACVVKVMKTSHMVGVRRTHTAREINIMRTLQHEYITDFHGAFEGEESVCIVQEYAAGGDLFNLLDKCGGRLMERTVVTKIMRPLLLALVELHARGIVHRDLKPENIFFSSRGVLKLGDFGLAIDTVEEPAVERLGTLDYMAPEILSIPRPQDRAPGEIPEPIAPYDGKVDVWAVGVLAFELVDGRPPFEVESEELTCAMILWSEITTLPEHLTDECKDFLLLCLRKDPKKRPSAQDLLSHPWITSFPADGPI